MHPCYVSIFELDQSLTEATLTETMLVLSYQSYRYFQWPILRGMRLHQHHLRQQFVFDKWFVHCAYILSPIAGF